MKRRPENVEETERIDHAKLVQFDRQLRAMSDRAARDSGDDPRQATFVRLYLGECRGDVWEAARRAGYELPDLDAANDAWEKDPRKTEQPVWLENGVVRRKCDRCKGTGTVRPNRTVTMPDGVTYTGTCAGCRRTSALDGADWDSMCAKCRAEGRVARDPGVRELWPGFVVVGAFVAWFLWMVIRG